MIDQSAFFMLASTMGQSILIETLRSAAYYACNSNNHPTEKKMVARYKEASSCFLFVQGTGLEELIQSYCMDYDADKLREGFSYCLRRYRLLAV